MKIAATTVLLVSLCSSFAFASNAALLRDIKRIKHPSIVKGELETTAELDKRKDLFFEQYSKRNYRIKLSIKNLNSESKKLVSYDNSDHGSQVTYNPDTEVLTVSIPEFKSKAVWITNNDGKKFLGSFCYIQTEPNIIKSDFYTAQNNYGAQLRVKRHVAISYGIAVLPENEDIKLPSFTTIISREIARDILEKGKLVIEAQSNLQRVKDEPSLLIIHEYEERPTINDPISFTQTFYMLPVELISVSLYNSKGAEILLTQATHQDTKD